ncbi:hypothetical protein BD779DRAFT_1561933 [Infundibulicybe gibba]|nr:hypothetical protein BD779DRAFT_1561933 [Infundibulicybe gibba]
MVAAHHPPSRRFDIIYYLYSQDSDVPPLLLPVAITSTPLSSLPPTFKFQWDKTTLGRHGELRE